MNTPNETGGYRESLRATARLFIWGFAWVATLAMAKFGPEHLWDSQAATWVAIAVNVIIGVGWIVAYSRFLQAIDELERKILQDALMVALGAGWIAGCAYVVADAADLLTQDVNVARLLGLLMGAAFLVTFVAGKVRYR